MMNKCPICRDDAKIVLLKKHLNLYRCDSCTHTFSLLPKEKQENYNDNYFLETHKNWMNNPNYRLFDLIHDESVRLSGNKQIRLLDVGCGNGDFLRYISAKNPKMELFGIDLVENKYPGIVFTNGDFLKEKIRDKFNIITSLAVAEHVDDPHLYVQKINDVLDDNGILFITTVNNHSLLHRIVRLSDKLGLHTAFDRIYSHHHLQHYSNRSLEKLMRMNGFDIIQKQNHNYPMEAVDIPKGNPLAEKINKLFVRMIFLVSDPLGIGMLQTIVCKKNNLIPEKN